MRKSLGIATLVVVLCCPAFAGYTTCPPLVAPPPPAPAVSGDMHTGVTASTPEVDELTRIALGLLQSVLTLL